MLGDFPAPPGPSARRAPLRQAGRPLRRLAFRAWFASQLLSTSGSMAQTVAQSWLMLQLTGRAIDLGVLGAATWLPVMFGASGAGGLVDRIGARRVLIGTQVLFMVVCGVQTALTLTGRMSAGLVLLFGALTGAISAADLPARQIYVVEIVDRSELSAAVGLNEVLFNAARIVGPAVGGVLLATAGVASCFAVNALSFLPVLVLLARFAPERVHVERSSGARRADGWHQVRDNPAIWSCMLVALAAAMLFNLGIAVPLLASRTFHLAGGGYAAMMASFGVGALPGAVVAASTGTEPTGPTIRILAALTGVTVLATAVAPTAALACAGIAISGFLSIWLIALANTLVQLESGPAVRGAVMGVWAMALPGSIPLTGLLTAVAAQVAGARVGYALAGVALVGVAAIIWNPLQG